MYSLPVKVKSKNDIVEMYETLSHFPQLVMLIKCGENTIDAHSLMGFFTIDTTHSLEILLDNEPQQDLKQAVSKFLV